MSSKKISKRLNKLLRKGNKLVFGEGKKVTDDKGIIFLLVLGEVCFAIFGTGWILFQKWMNTQKTVDFTLIRSNVMRMYSFSAWMIILGVLLVVLFLHELGHGFMFTSEMIEKTQWVFIAFMFGFSLMIETPKELYEKLSWKRRIVIKGGGALFQFVFVLLLLPVILFPTHVMQVFGSPQGVLITHVESHSPAELAGLQEGMIIQGVMIGEFYKQVQSTKDMRSVLNSLINETTSVTIITRNHGIFRVTCTYGISEKGKLGIQMFNYYPSRIDTSGFMVYYLVLFVSWFFWFQLTLAVLNLLPLGITDGDAIVFELVSLLGKNKVLTQGLLWSIRLLMIVMLGLVLS